MIANIRVTWEKGAYDKIVKEVPDKIVYDIAAQTLSITYPTIPERTGKMRQSSLARGVQGSNKVYRIGSYTDYATYVYNMPEKTHWTTPGTHSQWFARTLRRNGATIIDNAVNQAWKEKM